MKDKKNEKYNIICFSNQLWDFPNWTNKRHAMYRLAKQGHNVIFVDPPINMGFVLIRQIYRGLWKLKRIITQVKKDSESGATIYTPVDLLPFKNLTSSFHIFKLKFLKRRKFDPDKKTILWIYHVQVKHLKKYIKSIDHDILIYDCVDNYEGMPNFTSLFSTNVSQEELVDQERYLAKNANLIFVTAPGLKHKFDRFNTNVHFTPNVGDYERFKDSKKLKEKLPEDLESISRPRIGYIGALDSYKFDMELLKKVARDHPSYSFVIIGPMALKDREATLKELGFDEDTKNVHFMGSRPYEDKAKYLAGFDVDIIPYVLNDYTVGGCFPVKFHDSLAAGVPVVVTDLPAYMPFKDVCYISKTYEEFSKNIELALKEDNRDKVKQRQQIAKENNWDGKVKKMLALISTYISNESNIR